MVFNQRLEALVQLGKHLQEKDEYLDAVLQRTQYNNPWFTVENQRRAIQAIATHFLQKDKLEDWVAGYDLKEPATVKTVGIIMAGNIPLVGFHDLLCVFISGHRSKIKLSEKDKFTLPYLIQLLEKFRPGAGDYFHIVDTMKGFDAVIATGSNNSARYFEAYFGKYPHIIRKNRNAVAVLDGSETREELLALGKDVFRYFGLGCRSVSKLYLPEGYDFQLLLEQLHEYRDIILHHKYKHNFDYNIALLIMNKTIFWNNGCIILRENPSIPSRIAMLHYEFYQDPQTLASHLIDSEEEIQCIIGKPFSEQLSTVPFGRAQEPGLTDYADGVDVVRFLIEN